MVRYAKPAILEQIGSSHCVIEASAGTGKTYTLEHLVVQCLLDGVPLDKLLVVTFTKKATLELISRVRAKLEELVVLDRDVGREGEPSWTIGDEQKELLRQALNSFDRATISTIHGFCQQVLKDAAFEGARLFQQEAISSEEAFDRVFRDLLRTRYSVQDKARFELALEHMNGIGPLRKLLREASREQAVLVLPAPDEPKLALRDFPTDLATAFLNETASGPLRLAFKNAGCNPSSFPAMAARLQVILEGITTAQTRGVPEAFWQATDIEDLRKQACNFELPSLSGEAARLGRAYLRLLRLSPELLWVGAFLPPLLEGIERYKREEGLYDFDDMIQLVHGALLSAAGAPLVQRLRERFQVALIDEFQDTDALQWGIFQKVFLDSTDGHRLLLVGDPKQAIYGFRSGDLPTYTRAIQAVQAATGAEPLQLTTNFRSTPNVIEAYNHLLAGSEDAPFFTGGNVAHYKGAVTCGKPALEFLTSEGEPLPAIRVVEVTVGAANRTRRTCAQALAGVLQATIGSARFGLGQDAAVIRPEDVLVLTRSSAEGLVLAKALQEQGIPAAFYKQDGLFDGAEAQACRDFLLAVEAAYHESRRAKALLGPFFGLSFQEVEGCRELPENHPILKRLFQWRELAQKGRYGEFFGRIVSESGLTQRLLFLEEGQRTLTNLLHILELLQQEALVRHCTLVDLAIQTQRWIDGVERPAVEDGETQRLERESGAVQILTMHKAKGLEAPVIVLFGGLSVAGGNAEVHRYHEGGQGERRAWVGPVACASEDVQAWIQQEDVEEGERLLYVALTRAKGQLILPKYVVGEAKPKGQSSFTENGDPKGPYGCVNRRLRAVLGTPLEPKIHPRIQLVPSRPSPDQAEEPLAARLANWTPALPPTLRLPDFHALAVQGRPVWLWSYTGLQKGFAKLEHRDEEVEAYLDPPEPAEPGSRGGAKLGSRVHACFQQVELATFDGREFEAWQQDPLILALAADLLPVEDQAAALAWVYAGLSGALPLPSGGSVKVAQAKPILRELDFMMPYPGCRDLLQGSMDVLFQWEGKTYLLDWKTNRLDAYNAEYLQKKMDEEYLLQVKVYTLTACRFLGLTSAEAYDQGFGGVLYVFLRGLPDGGVWALRPSWSQVQEWEQELAGLALERLIPVHAGGSKDV